MNLPELTQAQCDALREISNIGMGHAATALSQLIGQTIMLHVPRITVTDISQVPDLLGGAEHLVAGITLKVLGDARGAVLLIFPQESIRHLSELLLPGHPADPSQSEMGASLLREVGNILSSAFLNALGGLLDMTLIPSIPMLAYDMAGAVVDEVLIDLSQESDLALLIETEFYDRDGGSSSIRGHFLLLPDPASLAIMMRAIGGEE